MGVTSIRLNSKEEKLLKFLKGYYNCDIYTLFKNFFLEMYEDIKDRKIIEKFEMKENKGKTEFVSFEDIFTK